MRMVFFAAMLFPLALPARAETLPGPVVAEVVRTIDGDTFLADAHVWPGQTIRVSVRIRGIDAPELKSRCGDERLAAAGARDALAGMIGAGPVFIRNIGGDKYFGRVLADVDSAAGFDVGAALLRHRHARAYGINVGARACD